MSPWSRICPMKPTVKPVSRLAAGVLVLASLALTGCYTAGGSGVSGQSSLAPTVLASPQSQTVALGAGASFTVTGSGTPLPSYQWQRSNDGGTTWTAITGATGTSYALDSTATTDNQAQFRAVLTDPAGSATSAAATLTVTSTVGTTQQVASLAPNSVPTGICTGPDGNLWFTNSGSGQIGKMDALTHQVSLVSLPNAACTPVGITPGPDGNIWFTEQTAGVLGAVSTAGVLLHEFPVGKGPTGIVTGSDGNLWTTLRTANQIARMSTAGAATVYALPTAGAIPAGITRAADGTVWFTEQGVGQIGQISPAGAVAEFSAPLPSGGLTPVPVGITTTADGAVWFSDTANVCITKFTVGSAAVSAARLSGAASRRTAADAAAVTSAAFYPLPAGSDPSNLMTDAGGNVWGAMTGSSQVVEITVSTPSGTTPTSYTLPASTSGTGPAVGLVQGSDGNVYVTGSDALSQVVAAAPTNTVEVIVLVPAPAMVAGASQNLQAVVTGAANSSVTWSVQAPAGGGSGGVIDPNTGIYTAPATGGVYTILATSQTTPPVVGTATVTVFVPAISAISPASPSVAGGTRVQFSAAVTNLPNETIFWSATDGVMNSQTGAWTAPYLAETVTITATSNYASSLSATTQVTITPQAAAITAQPAATTVVAGSAATFTVGFSGTPAPSSFQWQVSRDGGKTWANVSTGTGGTTATYVTAVTASTDDGSLYQVTLSNGAGPSVTSAAALLTVKYNPVISVQPTGQNVAPGATASFSVTAAGEPAPTYQWQVSRNGGTTWANVTTGAGAATAAYTTAATTAADNNSLFQVVLSNGVGAPITSSAASLTLTGTAPAITAQPASQTVSVGASATFTVVASGFPAPGYQWQVSTNGGTAWTPLAGATSASYATPAAAAADDGSLYQVVVSNGVGGSAFSTAARLTVAYAPVITTQPASQVVAPGGTATFAVVAAAVPAISGYQWQVSTNGGTSWTAVGGAVSASYVKSGVQVPDSGSRFRVGVTNSSGVVYSDGTALLTVPTAPATPVITLSPGAALAPLATGTASVPPQAGCSYAWTLSNGVITAGLGTPSIQFSSAPGVASGTMTLGCVVTNAAGAQAGSSVTVTVQAVAATLTVSPVSPATANVTVGYTQTFTATVTNAANTTVNWAVDGVGGGNASVGTISAAGLYTAGTTTGAHAIQAIAAADGVTQATATVTVYAGPVITSFMPSPASLGVGGSVYLTAVYSGGAGTVGGLGAVSSGVPLATGNLLATTPFTLTVTNGAGTAVTAQTTVVVGELSVLAGIPSGVGNLDGTGSNARFNEPAGVALDGAGNLYVADWHNSLIRKVQPGGVVTTVSTNGLGLNGPSGVAVDVAGDAVYVADSGNARVLKIADSVTTILAPPSDPDNFAGYYPAGLAVDSAGDVFVADSGNGMVWKIAPGATAATIVAPDFMFNGPTGVAVDGPGNVYVADGGVYKVTPQGVVTSIGTGISTAIGVAVDGAGNVFVTDEGNLQVFAIQGMNSSSPTQTLSLAGTGGPGAADGMGSMATFGMLGGIAVDAAGNLYVADFGNNTIRTITAGNLVSTLAGAPASAGSSDGLGSAARFNGANGLFADSNGNIFVADKLNCAVRMNYGGGAGTYGLSATYTPGVNTLQQSLVAPESFWPAAVTEDPAGNLYVADFSSGLIYEFSVSWTGVTSDMSTFYGTAGLSEISGLAFSNGYLYVADTGHNRIVQIDALGNETILAGNADGTAGDLDSQYLRGPASFNQPKGLAVGTSGNLIVADCGNNSIRKVIISGGSANPAFGTVSTVAGQPYAGFEDGPGNTAALGSANNSTATFNQPCGVAVDPSGNFLVADSGNNAIRMISPAHGVTTVAGAAGQVGTLGGDLPATLYNPQGITVDPVTGNLYVTVPDAILEVGIPTAAHVGTLPGTLTITAPGSANGLAGNLTASVPIVTDGAYDWSISGGTLTGGQGTNQVTYTANGSGSVTLTVTVSNESGGTRGATTTTTLTAPTPTPTINAIACSDVQVAPGMSATFTALVTNYAGNGGFAWSIVVNGTEYVLDADGPIPSIGFNGNPLGVLGSATAVLTLSNLPMLTQTLQVSLVVTNPDGTPSSPKTYSGVMVVPAYGGANLAAGNNHVVWNDALPWDTFCGGYNFVFAAGRNDFGQLGNGSRADGTYGFVLTDMYTGLNLASSSGTPFLLVDAAGEHSLAVDDSNNIYWWGKSNTPGTADATYARSMGTPPSPVVALADTPTFSIILLADQSVWAWPSGGEPVQVGWGGGSGVIALAATDTDANNAPAFYALDRSGNISAWGPGTFFQDNGLQLIAAATNPQYVAVYAGHDADLYALDAQGQLWRWSDLDSTLANGPVTPVQIPVPGSSGKLVSFAKGSGFQLALDSQGTVWATGTNTSGQLGQGDNLPHAGFVPVGPTTEVFQAVAAGAEFGVALDWNGNGLGYYNNDGYYPSSLWTWGANGFGELGNFSTAAVGPTPMTGLESYLIGHGWGGSQGPSLPSYAAPVGTRGDVILPGKFAVEQSSSQPFLIWGWDPGLFLNTAAAPSDTPERGTFPSFGPGSGVNPSYVFSSSLSDHALALDSTGNLRGWGLNSSGQLCQTPAQDDPMPSIGVYMNTHSLTYTAFSAAFTGARNSFAIDTSSNLWAWGDNSSAQLGLNGQSPFGDTSVYTGPQKVADIASETSFYQDPGHETPRAVAAGDDFTVLLTYDSNSGHNNLYTWGSDQHGQQGQGTSGLPDGILYAPQFNAFFPTNGISLNAISAGTGHVLALDSNGNVWAWGSNQYGQVGNGYSSDLSTPTMVLSQENCQAPIAQIYAGPAFSLALDTLGNVYGWGDNSTGALGIVDNLYNVSTLRTYLSPTQIYLPFPIADLAVTADSVLAIPTPAYNQNLFLTWGWNKGGRLGLGINTYFSPTPAPLGCGYPASSPDGCSDSSFGGGGD